MRLIDGDKLADEIDALLDKIDIAVCNADAYDAVSVVRCGMCKYSYPYYGRGISRGFKCKRLGQIFDMDFYCAHGEEINE